MLAIRRSLTPPRIYFKHFGHALLQRKQRIRRIRRTKKPESHRAIQIYHFARRSFEATKTRKLCGLCPDRLWGGLGQLSERVPEIWFQQCPGPLRIPAGLLFISFLPIDGLDWFGFGFEPLVLVSP